MKSIAVFCGSSSGVQPIYTETAEQLGKELARRKIDLVYGAGNVGLMGKVADAALAEGGQVIGVMPGLLVEKEVAHQNLTELIETETMHQRKQAMLDKSDGIVVLPDGIGTLEEFFEVFTWQQLGIHEKPVGILNTGGFYNHLLAHMKHMVQEGFLKDFHSDRILVEEDPASLIENMASQKIEYVDKWWDR